jgi:hypothetical protein
VFALSKDTSVISEVVPKMTYHKRAHKQGERAQNRTLDVVSGIYPSGIYLENEHVIMCS